MELAIIIVVVLGTILVLGLAIGYTSVKNNRGRMNMNMRYTFDADSRANDNHIQNNNPMFRSIPSTMDSRQSTSSSRPTAFSVSLGDSTVH